MTYYYYKDPGTSKYYFVEATTQVSTYDFPFDSPIYDPSTMNLIYNKGSDIPAIFQHLVQLPPQPPKMPQIPPPQQSPKPSQSPKENKQNPNPPITAQTSKIPQIPKAPPPPKAPVVCFPSLPGLNSTDLQPQPQTIPVKPPPIASIPQSIKNPAQKQQPKTINPIISQSPKQPETIKTISSTPIQEIKPNPSSSKQETKPQITQTPPQIISLPIKPKQTTNIKQISISPKQTEDESITNETSSQIQQKQTTNINPTPQPKISAPNPPSPTNAKENSQPRKQLHFIPSKDLSEELKPLIEKYHFIDYAKQHFNAPKKGFSKNNTMQHLICFSKDVIKNPLLKSISLSKVKNINKEAINCFETILKYTGVVKSRSDPKEHLLKLTKAIYTHGELRDEIYSQLIKQTTECPDIKALEKAWELFLLIATLFPSSRNSEDFIKSHIAAAIQPKERNELHSAKIQLYAELTYYRFVSRNNIQKNAQQPPMNALVGITKDPYTTCDSYGVSINEILWIQSHVKQSELFPSNKKCIYKPQLRIPYVLQVFSNSILHHPNYPVEGIFRISANAKNISKAIDELHNNVDYLHNLAIYDICVLFKQWWSDLPERIISNSIIDRFYSLCATGNPDDEKLLSLLEPNSLNSFLYLIGFLQEVVKSEETTKMGASNLGIVFAPNMYEMPNSLEKSKNINTYVKEFIERLILNFDTSSIYPLGM